MLTLFAQVPAQVHEPQAIRGLDVFLRENWRILLPLVLALAGVYLLLPRVKRISPALGGALAGFGLVLAALWWTRYETIWIEQLLFYIFSGLAILGAGLMLSQHNPVHAALAFALVVLSSCGLFLLLAAPFLMAATIIIYAGAIVVTFLFVIMLAQQAGISNADLRSREPFLGSLAGFLLLGGLAAVLSRGYSTNDIDAVLAKLNAVAQAQSTEDVNKVLGDPSKDRTLTLESKIRDALPGLKSHRELDGQVDTLEVAWSTGNFEGAKKAAAELALYAEAAKMRHGSLQAEKGLVPNKFQKTREYVGGKEVVNENAKDPAKDPAMDPVKAPADDDDETVDPKVVKARLLPAANVAALGNTLFTDHLIAVEMAGVLLLVATIGAIVIASRKSEGLR